MTDTSRALPAILPTTQLDYNQAMEMAGFVAKASLCPRALQGKPADVFIVLMRGAEMGLAPMQALQNLYVVNGKTGMSADLMRAKCLAHPDCLIFDLIESTAARATILVQTRKMDKPKPVSFEFQEAQKGGLVKADSGWVKWPLDMLVARATSRAARQHFPSVVAGLYTKEELEEIEPLPWEAKSRAPIVMPKAKELPLEFISAEPAKSSVYEPEIEPQEQEESEEASFEDEPEAPEDSTSLAYGLSIPQEAWDEVLHVWPRIEYGLIIKTITPLQQKRLFAIAKQSGWTSNQIHDLLHDRLGGGVDTLPMESVYEKVIEIFKAFRPSEPP